MALAALLPVLRLTGKVPYGAWTCCLGNSLDAFQNKTWSTHRIHLPRVCRGIATQKRLNTSPPSRFFCCDRAGWWIGRRRLNINSQHGQENSATISISSAQKALKQESFHKKLRFGVTSPVRPLWFGVRALISICVFFWRHGISDNTPSFPSYLYMHSHCHQAIPKPQRFQAQRRRHTSIWKRCSCAMLVSFTVLRLQGEN